MVIDTSAIFAILLGEPEEAAFSRAIITSPVRLMSAANVVESEIVAHARARDHGSRDLDLFLLRLDVEIAPVTPTQALIARRAFRRFGKGIHPASLNYGDCFAYALARETGEPLLYKGSDFSKTDIPAVRLGTA